MTYTVTCWLGIITLWPWGSLYFVWGDRIFYKTGSFLSRPEHSFTVNHLCFTGSLKRGLCQTSVSRADHVVLHLDSIEEWPRHHASKPIDWKQGQLTTITSRRSNPAEVNKNVSPTCKLFFLNFFHLHWPDHGWTRAEFALEQTRSNNETARHFKPSYR